jgi:hypothetical protein
MPWIEQVACRPDGRAAATPRARDSNYFGHISDFAPRQAARGPAIHAGAPAPPCGTVLASIGRVEEKGDSLPIEQMNNPFSH